ncbi:pseudouridine synthase family protein [Cavenderia fasciculata]|uniref:Pseudouridine synthase family protein n=1 Tax=Cavenderia fasciculata TaxID=261658 RepID=F4Q6S8_CACFS|nr:pseudouridine synthase family protein [Cavenderia fasciculata]EGG16588.1 pseudouridine synthase family protein [Cavenderia fasciculata]|eukprot:XP_004354988.1 pseudouridine synthase family protein [Cavenderia fasciculata]
METQTQTNNNEHSSDIGIKDDNTTTTEEQPKIEFNEHNKRLRDEKDDNKVNNNDDESTSSSPLTTETNNNNNNQNVHINNDDDEKEEDDNQITSTSTTSTTTSTTTTTNNARNRLTKDEKKARHLEKRRKKKQNKKEEKKVFREANDHLSVDVLSETNYRIEGPLRHVDPYSFTFKVNAKERWFGRNLLSMFTEEFSQLPERIYRQKIENGWIRVNGQQTTVDYCVGRKDMIEHRVHRHEPPVTSAPIKIVANDDEYVAVDKPSSIPVHPCGRFRHNSLIYVLAKEYGLNNLFGVHRLDRLTSGLLILAKSTESAQKMSGAIMKGEVSKRYVALVKGKFSNDEVVVDQPLKVQNHRLGLNMVAPDGKPSTTVFNIVSYDAETDTSVVCATPKTGRTHQIRLHLQWLGHPILNDPLYNNDNKPSNNNNSNNNSSDSTRALTSDGIDGLGKKDDHQDDEIDSGGGGEDEAFFKLNVRVKNDSSPPIMFDGIECPDCKIEWADQSLFAFGIYLHAFSYSNNSFSYTTDFPQWMIDHKDTRSQQEIDQTKNNPNTVYPTKCK